MTIKHIYWFAYFNMFSPSVRYRAKYPLELLNSKYGITYSLVFPSYNPVAIYHFVHSLFSCLLFRKKDSIIVLQRIHTKFIYSTALKILLLFQKKNTLYDLDDAEYFDHPNGSLDYFIKRCESCSVGSNAVKKYATKFNDRVFLLSSPVLKHDLTKTKRSNILTIGWIGDFAGSHRESMFKIFFPAIFNTHFAIKLVILGVREKAYIKEIKDYFSENKTVTVEIPEDIDWQNEMSVYSRVKEFDIGVCPLVNTEVTRAKSAFKIKLYFSCGVPALGSDVGENARFIENHSNGFICNAPEDYRKLILKIKEMNDEEYALLCLNAKRAVDKFDMAYYCATLIEFYK